MGTALTEDQLRLLKRFTRKIVLALDPDAAGQKAVLRGLDAARSALDREVENVFDARGLIHHEARMQADLRVASMPDGLDPDEIVERDSKQWQSLIQNAKPIVEYVIDTLIADNNVNDPKVKSQIAAQVLPLIEDLPDPIERDSYRQMLARRLRVDERAFSGTRIGTPRSIRRRSIAHKVQDHTQRPEKSPIALLSPRHKVEAACLEILLRRPDLLPRVDRTLQESGLNALLPDDFEYTDHQMIVKLVRQSLEQDAADAQKFVEDQIDEFLRETYTSLRAKQTRMQLEDKLVSEMIRQIVQMRRETLSESINQLRFLQEEAQSSGDAKASAYQELAVQHVRSLNYLDQARKKMRG
jgi:DNA primase